MSRTYNFFRQVNLPSTGAAISVDATGSFFRCIDQTAGKFEMSFDGGTFFEWQKGLKLKMAEGDQFTRLWFRIRNGTSTANTISFYFGTADVDDSRLNVIDESSLATIYTKPAAIIVVNENLVPTQSIDTGERIGPFSYNVNGLTRAYLEVTNNDDFGTTFGNGLMVQIVDGAFGFKTIGCVPRYSTQRFSGTNDFYLLNTSSAKKCITAHQAFYVE